MQNPKDDPRSELEKELDMQDEDEQVFTEADVLTESEREDRVGEIMERTKALTRLTADYLFLMGHRNRPGPLSRIRQNPIKAMDVMKKLEAELEFLEKAFGLDPSA